LTGYTNQIQDYIYLNPTGETFVSLRGTFNVYEYLQADAFFYGFDLSGTYSFSDHFNGYAKGSIIRAKNTETNRYFPFIPSDRMDWGLSYQFGKDPEHQNRLTLSQVLVAQQSREPDFDLAPAPPGYSLVNLGFSKKIQLFKHDFSMSMQVNNLLNTEFKEYNSRSPTYSVMTLTSEKDRRLCAKFPLVPVFDFEIQKIRHCSRKVINGSRQFDITKENVDKMMTYKLFEFESYCKVCTEEIPPVAAACAVAAPSAAVLIA
jgi:hypothetical protein